MEFSLIRNGGAVPLLIEEAAFEGVRKIGESVASDLEMVTGVRPDLLTEKQILSEEAVILCATCGRSPLMERLVQEGKMSLASLEGKREVYRIAYVSRPFDGVAEALVICGSDKRGTIYGMFALSEYLGVTPLVYWGDSLPPQNAHPILGEDICTLSKEPSVRYRGFFINDEWPCFGTWVTEHFGGFCAEAYRYVFEFLLRMKGNYLWPAMWTSSFPLDGPEDANEKLADLYGVIIGYSHHEPCLRASEEWDKVRGEESRYGNEWNFYTNRQGLLRYWEDALKRSGGYENMITIGMRGERDSSMLGDDASLAENIALLKDIITKQRQLIQKTIGEDLNGKPLMLALYKEVEDYFYGDGDVSGLKDWEGLEGVICMLCEDNYGNMRTLPTKELRSRKGGFGMYYHLDYHGGPVSYEWIDSTPLTKMWEQMCTAYEYGIRELWIVNVGDLKFHEVPLTFFMNMAYDFDTWGTERMDSAEAFLRKWAAQNFREAGGGLQERIARVFTEYIDLLHLRRPEALNEKVYHPCHYLEADRILERVREVERLSAEIMEQLCDREKRGYYSMVHFPAMAGMNLMKLQLYAGRNQHYASQGRTIANEYGRLAADCIEKDRLFTEEFGRFAEGKWNGMQLAPHIGFTRWNEDGCRYPVLSRVTPIKKSRLSVSRKDDNQVFYKQYGEPAVIRVDDFLSFDCDRVLLELANDGQGALRCRIVPEEGGMPDWLQVGPSDGTAHPEGAASLIGEEPSVLEEQSAGEVYSVGEERPVKEVEIRCLRERLPLGVSKKRLFITDGDTLVAVEIRARSFQTKELPPMTFLPRRGVVTMDAKHFCEKADVQGAGFRVLEHYGRYGSAVKVFPVTRSFPETAKKPRLTYQFWLEETGRYRIELLTAPTNSPVKGKALRLMVTPSGSEPRIVTVVPETFRAGDHRDEDWCRGVLDQIRTVALEAEWDAGVCRLSVEALDAGVVLERIRIYPLESRLADSYLGPEESPFSQNMVLE